MQYNIGKISHIELDIPYKGQHQPIETRPEVSDSQMLTTREPKGNKIRGFKVKTRTQKLKSQYVSSVKPRKTSEPMSKECLQKISERYVIQKWKYPHICLILVRK